MLETKLRSFILEHEVITDIIGSRLYPGWLPENASMPSVAYMTISKPSHHDIDVAFPRVQFSIFSKRYIQAKEIAGLLKEKLNRFKGEIDGTSVLQIVYQNEYDMYEQDTGLYHVAIDFKIIYWE